MYKKCKDHLERVEEGYFEHMFHALSYGSKMVAGGLAAIVHAFIPSLFQTTASTITSALHQQLQARLARAKAKLDDSKKS